MFDPYIQVAPVATESGFPWWLQVTHLVNFLFLGLLVRSGWEILASHPRLYWRSRSWLRWNHSTARTT